MTSDIANILKGYISPVGFSDKVAGLVKAVTVVDVNDDGTKTRRTFPISCDISYTECERGKYLDLVPNKKYRSIMYFEDGGSRITGDTPRDFVFTSSLRLVCWMNLSKLGKTDCSVSGLAVANILNLLPDNFNNSGMYSRIRITAVSQEVKSPAIFSKYTYKEETLQYLMYPYDYFAINIEVQYNVNKSCIEDWASGTELDCLEINVPSLCQSVIDRYNALTAEDKACVQASVCEATPCDDGSAVLKDSAGTTISTTAIPSGDTVNITAPDGVATVKNSANTTIDSGNVKSNGAATFNIADSHISNSDDSYSVNLAAEFNLELPDITLTQPNGDVETHPSVKNLVCDTEAVVYDGLDIAYNYPQPTGQTTSYATGDDAWYWTNVWQPLFASTIVGKRPQLADFTTLIFNNSFGNTNRFTDSLGTQLYANNYLIDHYTGLGWYILVQSAANWANSIAAAEAFSTLFSDWFVPNQNQQASIANFALSDPLNFAPFNLAATSIKPLWASTTSPAKTTFANCFFYAYTVASDEFSGGRWGRAKTDATVEYLLCRKHF